ncbi:signal recognition particle [Thermosipho melanesiensis]|uniref:Signal recognition particle protein n=2 Tax=Thermosipho melanesiensis TaxID=46541 RepID=A6LNZ0_THEM4|nr:signal recognition particle protein [Thermosipho melanesiensis]ABR31641.1 signal recognition particle protein [Thermosipho melanesiensis BI429]APT74670.1 signal recognition particle [Thermosipho melanesiensis]OOC35169.1 signal recognition particle [Thermosipho melanesiensis]OOC35379.1 signal recognition particle [Thermosipho melanesiensis]OOC36630.1 signal recognition particle [Thermosipho melanesiensis]
MFEGLQEKLSKAFKTLSGKGKITEKNIKEAIKIVKLSLLEADVNYKVVKEFIEDVKKKALGEKVLRSLTPDQMFIKILRDELIKLMGEKQPLKMIHSPSYIMMVGLQGSGKTTSAAKLANLLKKKGRKPYLVAADTYRPAAIDQLITLGKKIDVPVYCGDRKHPIKIVEEALKEVKDSGYDVVIFDTAGRLHIDNEMMNELVEIKEILSPDEILMVVDAMTGQDAVNSAKTFNEKLDVTGFVVTKMDGDARGGVILSIRYVTNKPVKFIGVGEKIEDLEEFYPERIASRILGLGDVLTLIEKAEKELDKEKMKTLGKKMINAEFTLEDFQEQLKEIKKLGSLSKIMELLPGAPKVDIEQGEREMKITEAIINSMTPEERRNPKILNASRKRRIALGSGTTVQDINKLLKNYEEMKKMMKMFKKGKLPFNLKGFKL